MCSNSNTLTLIHMPAWREVSIKGLIPQPLPVVDFGGCRTFSQVSFDVKEVTADLAPAQLRRGSGLPLSRYSKIAPSVL